MSRHRRLVDESVDHAEQEDGLHPGNPVGMDVRDELVHRPERAAAEIADVAILGPVPCKVPHNDLAPSV